MNTKDNYELCLRVAQISSVAKDLGIVLEVGSDFSQYRRLRLKQKKSRPMYPMFDVNCSYVDHSNGFWIAGFDDDGNLVHTQAMRFLNLRTNSLADHFKDHQLKYVTPFSVPDPENATFSASRGMDTITGSICYHGDFWLSSDSATYRGSGIIALLSRLAFELAHANWKPDFVFGLVAAPHALSGTPARHCYFQSAPGEWKTGSGKVFAEEWLVWMSAEDIVSMINMPFDASYKVLEAKYNSTKRRVHKPQFNGAEHPYYNANKIPA